MIIRTLKAHFGLICLIVLLILSIGLNVKLFNTTFSYYRQLNAIRLTPLNLQQYPHSNPMANSVPTVVFFGDSRSAAWPFPTNLPQFKPINRGIGAQTSAQVQLRYQAHVQPLRPNILLLQVGINDLKTIPLFPQQKAAIIESCQKNIALIVNQALNQKATVLVSTIFPVGQVPLARRPVWSPEVAEAVRTVNRYLHTLASQQVFIFDSYQLLVDDATGLIKPEYALDELHLNQQGYTRLNEALVVALLAIENNH